MSVQITDPLLFDLTAKSLIQAGLPPIVAGCDWAGRFQAVGTDGVGVPLTDALIVMTCRKYLGVDFSNGTRTLLFDPDKVLFVRRSTDLIPSTSIKQIEADANQSTNVGETGRGFFTVRFSNEDQAVLLAAAGLQAYDLQITLADTQVLWFVQGRVEIMRPLTVAS